MSDIIFIDDVITKDSPDGEKIENIIKSKRYSMKFVNTKKEIDNLLATPPKKLELVLLDLDLSQINKVDAEDILLSLVKNGEKVIILSGLPKTSQSRKKGGYNNYQLKLPDLNRLYNKGAMAYIYKSELDENEGESVANIIDRTIKDPNNSEYTLILDCELANFQIKNERDKAVIEDKNLSDAKSGWMTSSKPRSSIELILRLLFEMGRAKRTEVRISKIYSEASNLQKPSAIMPADFQKILGAFNESIRNKSNGLFAGRLLQGGGHGDRSGIYKANIGKIILKNYKEETINRSWKESIEKRLSMLEEELKKFKR